MFWSAVLLVQVLHLGTLGQIVVEPPEDLFFAVTYRDFLPSACFYATRNDDIIAIQKDAWGNGREPVQDVQDHCDVLFDNNLIWQDAINSGLISGHPDFEADGQFINQALCTEGVEGVDFPTGTCIFQEGPEFSIIKPDLVVGDNGLAKPVYCKDGPEDRCGFVVSNNEVNQTQTQKKFFDLWYNDDLTFNKRIGQKLRLGLVDPVNGRYQFDSGQEADGVNDARDGEIDAPEFGDLNLRHFGPLDRFKKYIQSCFEPCFRKAFFV